MKTNRSATLIQTDKFPVEWQEGDSHPPPGFDFAKSLLEEIKLSGGESSIDALDEDCWEHANWYFWLTWEKETYWFRLECSLIETSQPTWLVSISRSIGFFKNLLGKGKESDQIEASLQEASTTCIQRITGAEEIQWIDSDTAIDRLYGQGTAI